MAIQNGFIQIIQDEKRDYQYEEAMKTLRTNIQFSGNGLKVIMLTSTMPDEGKSETSSQLAISMAQTEGRVLFIDADIRAGIPFRGRTADLRTDTVPDRAAAFRGGSVSHEPAEPGYHFLRSDGTEPGRASERGCI